MTRHEARELVASARSFHANWWCAEDPFTGAARFECEQCGWQYEFDVPFYADDMRPEGYPYEDPADLDETTLERAAREAEAAQFSRRTVLPEGWEP